MLKEGSTIGCTMQQSFQVWVSKRSSRHAYSFVQYRESGRYTRRTDKRFHDQDIMFTTRNALANALPGRPDVSW